MNEPVKLIDLNSALDRLKEGINEAANDLDRDGVIQRFEFTFELVWKTIQEYAKYKGLEVVSPRDSFRIASDLEIIENPEVWFDFLKDRNESTHLYDAEQAKLIFSHMPSFIIQVEKLISNISKQLS